jgi:hypothetical protein
MNPWHQHSHQYSINTPNITNIKSYCINKMADQSSDINLFEDLQQFLIKRVEAFIKPYHRQQPHGNGFLIMTDKVHMFVDRPANTLLLGKRVGNNTSRVVQINLNNDIAVHVFHRTVDRGMVFH